MLLTVVVKPANQDAEVHQIETDDILTTCQQLVGGYVQSVGIGPGVNILCNEDGLGEDLPDNCGFVGTLVFVQDHLISEDEGYDWGSLDEDNVRKALAWCEKYKTLLHQYKTLLHPDRSGGIKIYTGRDMAEYRRQLAAHAQAQLKDWQSL